MYLYLFIYIQYMYFILCIYVYLYVSVSSYIYIYIYFRIMPVHNDPLYEWWSLSLYHATFLTPDYTLWFTVALGGSGSLRGRGVVLGLRHRVSIFAFGYLVERGRSDLGGKRRSGFHWESGEDSSGLGWKRSTTFPFGLSSWVSLRLVAERTWSSGLQFCETTGPGSFQCPTVEEGIDCIRDRSRQLCAQQSSNFGPLRLTQQWTMLRFGGKKVELLLSSWPPSKINELATRLILGCRGTAFQKLQLHSAQLLTGDFKRESRRLWNWWEAHGGQFPLEQRFEIVERALVSQRAETGWD